MNTLGSVAVSQQRQGCRDEVGKERYRGTTSQQNRTYRQENQATDSPVDPSCISIQMMRKCRLDIHIARVNPHTMTIV